MKEVSRFDLEDPPRAFLVDTVKKAQKVLLSICGRRDSGEWPANGAVFEFSVPLGTSPCMWLVTYEIATEADFKEACRLWSLLDLDYRVGKLNRGKRMALDDDKTKTGEGKAQEVIRVELYLKFSNDLDFHVDLDGLTSFINSRLDTEIYRFTAREFELKDIEAEQLVRLCVELPYDVRSSVHGNGEYNGRYVNRETWARSAVETVLLPAYMWIFARFSIGNWHDLAKWNFTTAPFEMPALDAIYETKSPTSGEKLFDHGVATTPRCQTMKGNYHDSWAQFRFTTEHKEAPGYLGFVNAIILEIEDSCKEDVAPGKEDSGSSGSPVVRPCGVEVRNLCWKFDALRDAMSTIYKMMPQDGGALNGDKVAEVANLCSVILQVTSDEKGE